MKRGAFSNTLKKGGSGGEFRKKKKLALGVGSRYQDGSEIPFPEKGGGGNERGEMGRRTPARVAIEGEKRGLM